MGIIYVIRCSVNDKLYVGQTTWQLNKRWSSHKKCARILVKIHNNEVVDIEKYRGIKNSALYNAMAILGIDNFTIEILKETNDEELNNLEVQFIDELNSRYPNGYNMTSGGGSKYNHTEETIELIKKIKKEKINQVRDPILCDMPVHFTYHKKLQAILLQNHRLCPFKTFSIKAYGSIDKAKEEAIKFITELELTNVEHVKERKLGVDLPAGVYEITDRPGGYRVIRQVNKITYRKDFTQDSPEENQLSAINYARDPTAFGAYINRTKTGDPDLPAGIIIIENGYKVQKRINKISYRRKFTSKKLSNEHKKQDAINYLNQIINQHNQV